MCIYACIFDIWPYYCTWCLISVGTHHWKMYFGYPGLQDEVRITLDCAQSDFIGYDKMVISLKGGEMWVDNSHGHFGVYEVWWLFMIHVWLLSCHLCSYVLTLITDGMRSVRAFHFDKAAASVLTTCVSAACRTFLAVTLWRVVEQIPFLNYLVKMFWL